MKVIQSYEKRRIAWNDGSAMGFAIDIHLMKWFHDAVMGINCQK
jgi:hypothetical protein